MIINEVNNVAGFGSMLKNKRADLGLSLKAAARKAGIKSKHLQALEEENIFIFQEKDAVARLLQKYAPVIKVEEDQLVRDFNELWSDVGTAKAYLYMSHKKESRPSIFRGKKVLAPGLIVLALVVVVAAGGYLAREYTAGNGREELTDIATPVTEEVHEPGKITADETIDLPVEEDMEQKLETGFEENNLSDDNGNEKLPLTEDPATGEKEPGEADDASEKNEQAGYEDTPVPRTEGNGALVVAALILILNGLLFRIILNKELNKVCCFQSTYYKVYR